MHCKSIIIDETFKVGTNCTMMFASDDQTTVRLGHCAPQCIIQKSLRNTLGKAVMVLTKVWHLERFRYVWGNRMD